MRLGAYVAELLPGSQVANAYGKAVVSERHRHRYEVNPRFRPRLEEAGLACSGVSPDGRLVDSWSCRVIRSGSALRPIRSSRAGLTGRTRSSGSWSQRRWRGPTGACRSCRHGRSTSVSRPETLQMTRVI